MTQDANPKRGRASRLGARDADYLTESEFVREMAGLAARYPNFKPTEGTWEAYWQDLSFVPKRYLLEGIIECRLTCKFFPSVAEVIQASIGTHFSVVPWNGRREARVQDIVKIYQERYRLAKLALTDQRRELQDKSSGDKP